MSKTFEKKTDDDLNDDGESEKKIDHQKQREEEMRHIMNINNAIWELLGSLVVVNESKDR